MRRFYDRAGPELPVALLALALFIMLAFQTVELVRQSQVLKTIKANQETPIEETQHLRQATDALAGDVAQLADSGNANAKAIVDAMARQHISLHAPPSQPAAAPSSEPAAATLPPPK